MAGEELLRETAGFITSVVAARRSASRDNLLVRTLLEDLAAFDSARGERIWTRDLKRDGLGLWHKAAQHLCGTTPVRPVNLLRVLPEPKLRTASDGGGGERGGGSDRDALDERVGAVRASLGVDVKIAVRLFLDAGGLLLLRRRWRSGKKATKRGMPLPDGARRRCMTGRRRWAWRS